MILSGKLNSVFHHVLHTLLTTIFRYAFHKHCCQQVYIYIYFICDGAEVTVYYYYFANLLLCIYREYDAICAQNNSFRYKSANITDDRVFHIQQQVYRNHHNIYIYKISRKPTNPCMVRYVYILSQTFHIVHHKQIIEVDSFCARKLGNQSCSCSIFSKKQNFLF